MSAPKPDPQSRPFLGVHLRCCNVYLRLYLNPENSAYLGFCPRCAKPVRAEVVQEGGSTQRFFEAS